MSVQKSSVKKIEILAPNFQVLECVIRGNAPLMVHKFSTKVQDKIEAKQTGKSKVKAPRAPKDYEAEFNNARYVSEDGWDGFYAGALRNAMIGAVRFGPDLSMTEARGLVFILPEGFDKEDGTPLVRIRGDKAKHDKRPGLNDGGGVDMRNRPRYDKWWAKVRVQYDADLLTDQDVMNLLARAGVSVGICEGRPMSKKSGGIGFGTFDVRGVSEVDQKEAAA